MNLRFDTTARTQGKAYPQQRRVRGWVPKGIVNNVASTEYSGRSLADGGHYNNTCDREYSVEASCSFATVAPLKNGMKTTTTTQLQNIRTETNTKTRKVEPRYTHLLETKSLSSAPTYTPAETKSGAFLSLELFKCLMCVICQAEKTCSTCRSWLQKRKQRHLAAGRSATERYLLWWWCCSGEAYSKKQQLRLAVS